MHCAADRRRFLAATAGAALGAVAGGAIAQGQEEPESEHDLTPKPPHHPPRAAAMISLFMQGGPSHLDLFDPKPELVRRHGRRFPGEITRDNAALATGTLLASPWKFRRRGQSGTEISELLPHLAKVIDEVCLIRSIHIEAVGHGQALDAIHTGRVQSGRPVLASWLLFGRGSESGELPAFVVLPDAAGLPVLGTSNWSCGWLPSVYGGQVLRPRDRETIEALDVSGETAATHRLYGLDREETREYGTRLLVARRLVERGVRCVQVYTAAQAWDHHARLRQRLPAMCKRTDQPAAALIADLKQRGLLETTLVHWGGEMGRLPVAQNDLGPDQVGRDHNTHGFSLWLAGGGIRGGMVYGRTDAFGFRAEEDVVTHKDFLATVLYLFGLDYKRLFLLRGGEEHSLIDKQLARVLTEVLA